MANRRRKRKLNYKGIFTLALFALMIGLLVVAVVGGGEDVSLTTETEENETKENTVPPTSSSVPEVTGPYVTNTATLGITGDILIHEKVYLAAAAAGNGDYDFTENYEFVKSYFSQYDYTVANLEVTLGGKDPVVGKYPNAYPSFNSPDSVADALKAAGVDMLLTANNHSYDTRMAGLLRTVGVLKEKGIDHLGTRETANEDMYTVKEIDGIKFGMACFTYSTVNSSGIKSLNGISMTQESSPLVSSFAYDRLDEFYAEAERALQYMEANGAEVTVFYMHWGEEYQNDPNASQKSIAQKLSDFGVDVIVGGHPHVVQPFETIKGQNGNETLCIYSVGNCLSNQRREEAGLHVYGGRTEDGMIFGLSYEKLSDGTVRLKEVDIQPLWVIRETRGGRFVYQIIPLDLAVSDWSRFHLSANMISEAKDSYARTMETVGKGLNAAREALGLSPRPLTVS